jgi:hypothetical protein
VSIKDLTRRVETLERLLRGRSTSGDAPGALPAYRLLRDIPGAQAGTIFVHDADDRDKGSIASGCLKNAWDRGNTQQPLCNFCAETHVFPGQMANATDWFERVANNGRWRV